ncbi:MAG TPA: peptide chain release factor N(5)-glutamine methyltransferase [Candidatus Acidoferrum sp.]|nr:peptide chain release factor N(5)-glutamine methyltransferase [Candidatus Acidoferrum sp.]
MTVLEAIQKSTEFLAKKGVDSPRLQTELLLAQLLKLPRMMLYLNFERVLTTAETDALRELVRRRGQREPLQHLTGSTSFCGFEIAVSRHALVPRPETELLAEAGWEFLCGRADLPVGQDAQQRVPTNALDFGTGTGCIAIALAAKCPAAKIVATDISPEALALARENAARNNVIDRVEFVQGDGFAALHSEGRVPRAPNTKVENEDSQSSPLRMFDLIISNPPYVRSAEIATLQPEVRDFDPRVALDGGADGLDFYRRLAAEAKPFLKTDGKIMLEFGDGQAEAIRKIFETEKWIVEAVKEDYSHRQRILIARK